MNVYTFAFLTVVVILVGLYIAEKVTGTKIYPYIVSGKPVVAAVGMLAKALSNTTNNEYMKTISIVADAAVAGADHAEQLWLDNVIEKEEREKYAHDFISQALAEAGIAETEKIMKVADGFIAIACALMPHGLVPWNNPTE